MSDDVRLSHIDLIEDDDSDSSSIKETGHDPCSRMLQESGLVTDADAFAEIAAEVAGPGHDCLTVLCGGICPAELIVESIVRACTKQTDLILLFNLSSSSDVSSKLSAMEQHVRDRLALLSPPLPMTKVSSAIPALVRQRLYISGHVFSMPLTTASLDLIQGVLVPHLIKGIIILDAHKVVPGSREALVLRLIRDGCGREPAPFLKLFTSNAVALDGAYNRLERVLLSAFIVHVHFWPRFRVRLRNALERTPIDDVAVEISLTDSQKQIQDAIKEVLLICIDEALASAKRYLPDVVLPTDNLLAAHHDLRLRCLLRSKWHNVGQKTRQLIADIALLRKLFALLVSTDCVSFYRFLRSIQTTPRTQHSQWLLTAPADRLFKLAKRRVYSVASGPKLAVHLQPNPKWAIVRQILDEIRADGIPRCGPVLIICEDVSSCAALREILQMGADAFLNKRWFQFLHSLRLKSVTEDDGDRSDKHDEVSKAFAAKRIEQRLLLEEYRVLLKARKSCPNEGRVQTTLTQFGMVSTPATKAPPAKRGRKKARFTAPPAATPAAMLPRPGSVSLREAVAATPSSACPSLLEEENDLVLMFWARGSDFIPINTLNSMYIIVYDSVVGVLRELEMAKSRCPSILHRVYTVMYEESIEDAVHQDSIRRECDVFESLAQQKARMVLPSAATGTELVGAQTDLGSTRKGGGVDAIKPLIIVDIREFRSSLPGTLYESGVRIVPVTLEIGDYVLTPDICVERKSVADLVGSLNSGRLFTQLTAMKRLYTHPFLLIEFDANGPFSFQVDLYGAISSAQICTRLAMICLAFPEIRMIWSRSSQATASMFLRLKSGRPQPDVAKAATIKNDDENGDSGSYVATDILRRLPGVTLANIHQLMLSMTCLADLVKLDKTTLSRILGATQATNLLDFLGSDMAV